MAICESDGELQPTQTYAYLIQNLPLNILGENVNWGFYVKLCFMSNIALLDFIENEQTRVYSVKFDIRTVQYRAWASSKRPFRFVAPRQSFL